MRIAPPDLPLPVLIYPNEEEGGWTALSLEMDIRAYGDTPEEALDELSDLVYVQISFAVFKDDPSLIWKRAEISGPVIADISRRFNLPKGVL